MEIAALVNKVKTKIDEISTSDTPLQSITMADEKPIDTIIKSLLDESALEILLKAPFYRLSITDATSAASTITATADKITTTTKDESGKETTSSIQLPTGTIKVPDNFLRLVSFRMSDWQRSVTELATKGDAVSRRQSNKNLRGGISRPIGVLTKNSSSIIIEYYSTYESTHKISEFLYIARTTADKIADSQMIEAMTWICAGRALSIMGDAEAAKNAYDNAQSLMMI